MDRDLGTTVMIFASCDELIDAESDRFLASLVFPLLEKLELDLCLDDMAFLVVVREREFEMGIFLAFWTGGVNVQAI